MSALRLRRVGHKGADLIAPGNTIASFDAALAAGVDMIEFDVLREEHGSRLVLAHDYEDAASAHAADARGGARSPRFGARSPGSSSIVDLKLPGYELRVRRRPARRTACSTGR